MLNQAMKASRDLLQERNATTAEVLILCTAFGWADETMCVDR